MRLRPLLLACAFLAVACDGGQEPTSSGAEGVEATADEAGDDETGDDETGDEDSEGATGVADDPDEVGSDAADAAGGPVTDDGGSCALTTTDAVAEAFGADSATAEPALTSGGDPICHYRLSDGLVPNVYVRHRGAATEWDDLVFHASVPPVLGTHVFEEVPGIGDDAFYHRTSEIVLLGVRLDPDHFTITFSLRDVRPPVTGAQLDAALTDLAKAMTGS